MRAEDSRTLEQRIAPQQRSLVESIAPATAACADPLQPVATEPPTGDRTLLLWDVKARSEDPYALELDPDRRWDGDGRPIVVLITRSEPVAAGAYTNGAPALALNALVCAVDTVDQDVVFRNELTADPPPTITVRGSGSTGSSAPVYGDVQAEIVEAVELMLRQ